LKTTLKPRFVLRINRIVQNEKKKQTPNSLHSAKGLQKTSDGLKLRLKKKYRKWTKERYSKREGVSWKFTPFVVQK